MNLEFPDTVFQALLMKTQNIIELHGVSEAPKKVYRAIAFICSVLTDKGIITNFIEAKSKVSPLKSLSTL